MVSRDKTTGKQVALLDRKGNVIDSFAIFEGGDYEVVCPDGETLTLSTKRERPLEPGDSAYSIVAVLRKADRPMTTREVHDAIRFDTIHSTIDNRCRELAFSCVLDELEDDGVACFTVSEHGEALWEESVR